MRRNTEKQVARRRALSQERLKNGLCVACGRPHPAPPQKCRDCTASGSRAMWRWKQGHLKARPTRAIRGWNFDTDDLITEHVGLAKKVARGVMARQMSSSTVDVDDIFGDAMYGLVVAGRTYDPTYNVPFGPWAATQIRGAIYNGIRNWCKRGKNQPVFVSLDEYGDAA